VSGDVLLAGSDAGGSTGSGRITTTFHLKISGGTLLDVVMEERRYDLAGYTLTTTMTIQDTPRMTY